MLLAAELHAQPAAEPSEKAARGTVRVYGIEVESSPLRDRVLVFADGPVRPQVQEPDPITVVLIFPGATLDPSAPTSVPVEPGGPVKKVSVLEVVRDKPEVRITIVRSAGVSPSMSHRGQQVALDFDRPGEAGRPRADGQLQRTLPARWIDIEVSEAVERLARFVDARLIFDDTLRGTVSIEALEPLTEGEAAAMLDALLLMKGFVAVASPGGARKILPTAGAQGPWVEELATSPNETPLVTLIRLRDVDAELVRQAISPLVGNGGLAQGVARHNAILLAGAGNRLRRLVDVIQTLDETGARRLVLIPLRHADAQATSDALLAALNNREGELEVWPDARTNRLVVRGRPDAVRRARELVARLDRPFEGTGGIQVIPVRYMDADRLATSLTSLATQQETSGARGAGSLAGRAFSVSVHGPTRSLVVQAHPDTIRIVRELVAELDVPPARVDVEVMIVEVVHSNSLALAFDTILPFVEPDAIDDLIAGVVTDPGGTFGGVDGDGFFGGIRQSPLLIPIVNAAGDIVTIEVPRASGVVTADATQVHSRLLQRPRLSMISGEEHEIFAGVNVPVPVASTAGSTNALTISQTIERRDTGIRVRIEPTVPKEGPIALRLEIDLSAVSESLAGGPTFLERSVSTTVRLEPGRVAVIGWARLPSVNRSVVGVPFLMNIPFIGQFFRSTSETELSMNLIIAVRAERRFPEAEVLTSWMRRELAAETATEAAAAGP